MSKTDEEIKALESLYQECEANLTRSAEYGKELMEKINELQEEKDTLLQERHTLKQTLDTKTALEVSLLEELEAVKKTFSKDAKSLKDEKIKLLNDHETKYNQWKDAESRLELKIEGLQSLITEQKQRIQELERNQTDLISTKEVSFSTSDEKEQLQADLSNAKFSIQMLKETMKGLEHENEELKEQVETLRANIKDLKDVIEEKDSEIAEMFPSLNGNPGMSWEDETLDSIDTATNKGNSLFSEVDDRRLLVENQLEKYKSKFEELKTVLLQKNRQMSRLRAQNVTLMNITSGGSESSSNIRRLEELLEMERNKSSALTSIISELEKNPATAPPALTSKRRETVFGALPVLKTVSGDSEQDIQIKLRNQIRQALVTEDKLRETVRDMGVLENNYNKLKSENFQLKMRIQSINDKKELSADALTPKVETVKEMIVFDDAKPVLSEKVRKEEIGDDNVFASFLIPSSSINSKEKPDRKSKGPKKVVSFSETSKIDETSVDKSGNSSPVSQRPRKRVAQNKLIDCDEEDKKMKEACVQQ